MGTGDAIEVSGDFNKGDSRIYRRAAGLEMEIVGGWIDQFGVGVIKIPREGNPGYWRVCIDRTAIDQIVARLGIV